MGGTGRFDSVARDERLVQVAETGGAWIVILGAGILARSYDLGSESLWVDEVYSVAVRADATVPELLTAPDPHPPLYYALLGIWMDAFGTGAVSARSLSVCLGVATIPLIYLLGRELATHRAGLLTAAVLAVTPIHVQYSREARMYALLVFLATLTSWLYVRYYRTDHEPWVLAGYTLATVALLYTHAFAVFVLAAHALHAIVVWYREPPGPLPEAKRLVAVVGVLTIAILPLVGQATSVLDGDRPTGLVTWISEPGVWDLTAALRSYSGRLINYPFYDPGGLSQPISVVALSAVLVGAFSFLFNEWGQDAFADAVPAPRSFALLLLGVPILGPFVASSVVFPMYVVRYTLAAIVGFALFAGTGTTFLEYRPVELLLAVAIVGSLAMGTVVYHDTETNEPWGAVADQVAENHREGDVVHVEPEWATTTMAYHMNHSVEPASNASATELDPEGRIWLIVRNPAQEPTSAYEPDFVVTETWSEGTLTVFVLVPAPEPPSNATERTPYRTVAANTEVVGNPHQGATHHQGNHLAFAAADPWWCEW